MLPRQGKSKGIHHHQAIIIQNVKNKLSKQVEEEQNHVYGDHLEDYLKLGWGRGRIEEKEQGLRSTNW